MSKRIRLKASASLAAVLSFIILTAQDPASAATAKGTAATHKNPAKTTLAKRTTKSAAAQRTPKPSPKPKPKPAPKPTVAPKPTTKPTVAPKPKPTVAPKPKPTVVPSPTIAPQPTTVVPEATVAVPTKGAAPLSPTDIQMVGLVDAVLADLNSTAPAGAPPGTWIDSTECFRCDAGPALALAAAAAVTGDASRQAAAEKIFDYEINAHQQANGAFGTNPVGPDLDTMFFANELGIATVLLKPTMDPARYGRWSTAVAKAADFLIKNGNLAWYTNGNIVVGNTLTMALAARLTGNAKYLTAYETALTFAVSPPQSRWPGYGFVYTSKGTQEDGRDSKGYFTEAVSEPGFDAEYTMLQLDLLSPLYLINKDHRVLRYLNAITNQLWDRVNTATWRMDTSGGTRHPQIGREFPYDTASVSVLANVGGRTDLEPYISSQIAKYTTAFRGGRGDRLKYAFGLALANVLMSQPGNSRLR
ncbi:hypothetical protein AB0J80_03595 [Actinoplanes sp. NPDC049548]|uniref:hypothetical protein n=1 Tax=Actinoplanes sp. NPDC049548 TaxID=3155152 RepID=UPI003414971A